MSWMHRLKSRLCCRNAYVREGIAELLGTFILVVLNLGAVAQVVLSRGTMNSNFGAMFGGGLGVAFAIYIAGGVSGAHINPAVSLAFCVVGKLKWKQLPVYVVAQYIGAFLAAFFVLFVYKDAFDAFDGGVRQSFGENGTAAIFSTHPQEYLSRTGAMVDQIFGTAILLTGIMALTDKQNLNVPLYLMPLLVGLLVLCIGLCFGLNCGYPLNPARDFAPRLFTALAGWGPEVFGIQNGFYVFVPILGPHIGGVIGALLYTFLISNHWPAQAESFENKNYEITQYRKRCKSEN